VSDNPGGNHHRYTGKARNHPDRPKIIGPEDNVVHISLKSGQRHQRNVDESKDATQSRIMRKNLMGSHS
jgi:hypothetical protein